MFPLTVMPPPFDVRLTAPDVVVTPDPMIVKLPVFANVMAPLVEFTIWRLATAKPTVRFTPSVESWFIRSVVDVMLPDDLRIWPFDVLSTVSRPEMSPLMVTLPVVVVTVVMPPELVRPRIVTAVVKPAVTLPAPELTDVKVDTDMPLRDAPVTEFTARFVVVIVPAVRLMLALIDVSVIDWPAAVTLALTVRVPVVEIVIVPPVVLVDPEIVRGTELPVKTIDPDVLPIWTFETVRPDVRVTPALLLIRSVPAVIAPRPVSVIVEPAPVAVSAVTFNPLLRRPSSVIEPDVVTTIVPPGLEMAFTVMPPPSVIATEPLLVPGVVKSLIARRVVVWTLVSDAPRSEFRSRKPAETRPAPVMFPPADVSVTLPVPPSAFTAPVTDIVPPFVRRLIWPTEFVTPLTVRPPPPSRIVVAPLCTAFEPLNEAARTLVSEMPVWALLVSAPPAVMRPAVWVTELPVEFRVTSTAAVTSAEMVSGPAVVTEMLP